MPKHLNYPPEPEGDKRLARWGVVYFWAIVLLTLANLLT